MDMLCESKVVDTAMRLLENDGWKTIGDETLPDIPGLLKDLSSASAKAVKSLFDLGVCDLLKQMITYYTSSHSNSDRRLLARTGRRRARGTSGSWRCTVR